MHICKYTFFIAFVKGIKGDPCQKGSPFTALPSLRLRWSRFTNEWRMVRTEEKRREGKGFVLIADLYIKTMKNHYMRIIIKKNTNNNNNNDNNCKNSKCNDNDSNNLFLKVLHTDCLAE